ncbi:MAG: pyrroline-5-carboxylate reductase [Thermodesulfobacteriota bacterium]|nr:MAG: pyrroline-5-carboxylate reductase [Thermodesulfobacteriota bacterium]RLG12054.1 MAG: pyrroline-5-carboxylate reductase [Candidatus Pacearchaeota archaeon]
MEIPKEIGIIGGGQMGEALIKGFLEKDLFSPKNILVSEPVDSRREYLNKTYNVSVTTSNKEVVETRKLILLAVKPQVMKDVLEEIKDLIKIEEHLILTIAAGLPISFYEKFLPSQTKIIRIMPNTCALVHKSMSALCKNNYATEEDLGIAESLFSAIGKTVIVEENLMDAVTALSGSGPAYVSLFIESLIDAGVNIGLPRPLAEKLVLQTVKGSVKLITKGKKNPYELKSMVTSPGGTTISALQVFYEKGLPGIIMSGVHKAYLKSKELSKLFG